MDIQTPLRRAKRRKLLSREVQLIPASFRHSINIGRVELVYRPHNLFAMRKILARNNTLYWPNCPDDFTQASIRSQALLMHELCHVWQYYTGRLSVISYLINPANWQYHYDFMPQKTFDDYPTEKQANLLEDWYLVNMGQSAENYQPKSPRPTREQINQVVPFKW